MILQLQKKKKKVENYQNPSVSREYTGPYRWHGVGWGSDSRKRGPGKVPPPPPAALGVEVASRQHHSACSAQLQLSKRIS